MRNRSLEHTIRDVHELYGSGSSRMSNQHRNAGAEVNPSYSSKTIGGHGNALDGVRRNIAKSQRTNVKAEETVAEAKKKEYEGGPEKKPDGTSKTTVGDVADTAAEILVPGYDAYKKFKSGDYAGAAGSAALDVGAALAAAPTLGASWAARSGIRAGLKAGEKIAARAPAAAAKTTSRTSSTARKVDRAADAVDAASNLVGGGKNNNDTKQQPPTQQPPEKIAHAKNAEIVSRNFLPGAVSAKPQKQLRQVVSK